MVTKKILIICIVLLLFNQIATAFSHTFGNGGKFEWDNSITDIKEEIWLNFNGTTGANANVTYNKYIGKNQDFTVTGWFNFTGYGSDSTLFENIKATDNRFAISIAGTTLETGLYNGSVYHTTKNAKINYNQIYFFAVIYNKTEVTLYINKTLQTTSSSPSTGGTVGMSLGSKVARTNPFNGSIYKLVIYGSALNEEEVFKVYDEGAFNTGNLYPYDIDSYQTTKCQESAVDSNDTIYCYYSDYIRKVNELGVSWSSVLEIGKNVRMVFIDSEDTIFTGNEQNNSLKRLKKDGSAWEVSLNFTCRGEDLSGNKVNGTALSMVEDDLGYLYVGEYTEGQGTNINCSYIYRSIDHGDTWSIVYNASEQYGSGFHIHSIMYNPNKGCLYAAQGDNIYGCDSCSRLLRSCDSGNTWITILEGINIFSMGYQGEYNIFGYDESPSYIIRTNDDTHFENASFPNGLYPNQSQYKGYWFGYSQYSDNIYFSTYAFKGNYSSIWHSNNSGQNWTLAYKGKRRVSNGGIQHLSNPDSLGNIYFVEDSNTDNFVSLKYDLNPGLARYLITKNSGSFVVDYSDNKLNMSINNLEWGYGKVGVNFTPSCTYNSYCNSTSATCSKDISGATFETIGSNTYSTLMCRAEDNDPYVTEMATTITDYTVSYTDGIVYDITGTGTGTHKVTNLLDLAGEKGYYNVYHNGGFVELSKTNDYTMDGFSNWYFEITELGSKVIYNIKENYITALSIIGSFISIIFICIIGFAVINVLKNDTPINFKEIISAITILLMSVIILTIGIIVITQF